jgi:UDP-N-acetylmuramate dehydrogenase
MTEFFEEDNLILRVAAGENWDKFVSYAVSLDCAGVECLAGIPGTVGGTPVQNVGAYGQEVSETIRAVRAYDLASHAFVDMTAGECEFSYRQSRFNTTGKGRYIVTRVDYSLVPGGAPRLTYADVKRHFQDAAQAPSLAEVANAVRAIRREKGMYLVDGDPNSASAGSFFKNPVVDRATLAELEATVPGGTVVPQYPASEGKVKLAAAWLLEQAGFTKGYGSGRAGISSQHTLALVNRGGATSKEVVELSEEIIARVEKKFGVKLEQEPVYLQ